MNVKNPAERLREAAEVYEHKSKEYGDNYKQIGHVMAAMFPSGLKIQTPDQWNKLHLFLLGMVKKTRLAVNFGEGHDDSLIDDMVYDAMLLEVMGAERQRRDLALDFGSLVASPKAEASNPVTAQPLTSLAASPALEPLEKRETFEVPVGFVGECDAEGRATGKLVTVRDENWLDKVFTAKEGSE